MAISTHDYATALHNAIGESNSSGVDKIIDNLIEILKANNDLDKYKEIVEEFEVLEQRASGVKKVEMATTEKFEVNKEIIADLNSYVEANVKVEQNTDETLVGGVVLRVDDTLIDASIKGNLETLREDLKK